MKTKICITLSLLFWVGNVFAQEPINIIPGTVVDTVKCDLLTEQSYSTYLPSYYTPDRSWPVIYIFEPAARGVLPVKIFKSAAEKWGYIIISSNNSRNGNWQWIFEAADAMFVDTHKRFNIDQDRIYTSGFSGGGRASIAVARLTGQVRGIIGCGAGSPNLKEHQLNEDNKVPYVGIIGDVDMNYLEVKDQENTFNEIGIKNIRLTWPSIHQWPPSHMIDKAMQWLEYQTNDTLSVNRQKLIELNFKSYRDSLFISGNQREAIRIAEYLDRDMAIQRVLKLTQFEESKVYNKESKALERIEKREFSHRSTYFTEAAKIPQTRLAKIDSVNPIKWWTNEIDKWNKKKDSKNINVQRMSLRLLNQIWASSAERSFDYERRQDYELALRLNEIWVYAQPNSVWALWSRAKLFALNGDKQGALEYLELAHKKGMSKAQSITGQPAFSILIEEKRFKKLLSELSQ